MDLVNRLKYYMDSTGLTISQFADRCAIPRPSFSQIMNGRNKRISDEVISKIHSAFPGLSVMWLMFGEGEMETDANTQFSEPQNGASDNEYPIQETDIHEVATDDPHLFSAEDSYRKNQQNENSLISFDTEEQKTPKTSAPAIERNLHNDITRTLGDRDANTAMNTAMPQATADTRRTFATESTGIINNPASSDKGKISISTDAGKKITNIVVFYSDNSFQSFLPDL